MAQLMQNNLLMDCLRGPLYIKNSQIPYKQKYVRAVGNCSKCFKHSTAKCHSDQNNISIQNIMNHKTEEDETGKQVSNKFNFQQFQVSKLKQMENTDSKIDRDKICQTNIQLGQRMRYNYKNTSRSIRPFSVSKQDGNLQQNGIHSTNGAIRGIRIILKKAKSQRPVKDLSLNFEDNSLALSAVSHMQSCQVNKDSNEWNDFRSQYPNEAGQITQHLHQIKRQGNRKTTLLFGKKELPQAANSQDKSICRASRNRKNSLNSSHVINLGSQLLDVQDNQSQNSSQYLAELVLEPNFKDQPDVVLNYVMNGQKFCDQEEEILGKWIFTLPQEQRMEIEKDKKYFPIPRNIDQTSIRKGLDKLYGVGKQRRLRPGEEALLLETINGYLEDCLKNPQLITYSVSFIINNILKLSAQEELLDCPLCMKQLECHWKLMATRFRYSGQPIIHSKKFEKQLSIAQARGHFLDLTRKDNPLVVFLLKHQMRGNPDTNL